MATPVAYQRKPSALGDEELAKLAIAGDGHAFAELYDRHEQRVYGFCMRMLGAPHDAADATQETFVRLLARLPALEGRQLNFVAYALACARNACYDMIEGRRRVEPVAEDPDGSTVGQRGPHDDDLTRDPERAALLAAARKDVQAANAELPARQREVLALREVELLSYDEIGEIMGLNRNAVAQLVSRARIKLRDLLHGSALASVSASSADCARALPLLASVQDEQRGDPEELDWVRAHLAGCDTCRLSRAAMEEAGVSYRTLAPIVPLAWLRHAAIARAAEFVGADWSKIAAPTPGARVSAKAPAKEQAPGRAHVAESTQGAPGRPQATQSILEAPGRAHAAQSTLEAPEVTSRLARWTLAAAAALTLCLVLVLAVGSTRDGHVSRRPPASDAGAHPAARTAISTPRPHHRTATAHGSKREHALDLQGSPPTAAHIGTGISVTPEHSSTRPPAGHHRHRASAKHQPAPTVGAPLPPSTTSTTPNPPTPTPPPTTTTPPTQPTPAPTPPTTSTSESTGTISTPSPPPEERSPGGLIP